MYRELMESAFRRTPEKSPKKRELEKVVRDKTAELSHELRTPLCVIKEGIHLILEGSGGPVTEFQRETLTIANTHVDRLVRLIDNILDFGKAESGRIQMFLEPAKMDELVEESCLLMKVATDRKKIDFTLTLPEEPVVAVCDADKIKQILINLIDNAVKFTEKGGKIAVKLDQQGDHVRMTVEDNGIGIPQEDQAKIFEMFEQSSENKVQRAGGAGVGLAVCKKYMELHSGRIVVESIVGNGSRFTLFFPKNLRRGVIYEP